MIRKSLVDARLSVSGVTAWVTSAISRATMQNDLKLLPLTMRAPPSVTSSTACIFHDWKVPSLSTIRSFLSSDNRLRAVPFFLEASVSFHVFRRGGPEFFSTFRKHTAGD